MSRVSVVWAMVLVLASACVGQQTPSKKRLAILNFEYGTVQSSVAAIFGSNQDVGKGISDLLVQKLVEDGKYSVIERNALDKVLTEQNFSNSDRADATTAAKIGRVLGVDAVVLGSITQFGRDDKNTTVGGAGFGNLTSKFGIGGAQKRDARRQWQSLPVWWTLAREKSWLRLPEPASRSAPEHPSWVRVVTGVRVVAPMT